MSKTVSTLKSQLQVDLTASMKARDELRTGTLRMTLAAVQTEEASGKAAHELTDAQVEAVLTREANKRREAAEAFDGGGRPQQAARERAEGEIIAGYLPPQLADDELTEVVTEAMIEAGLAAAGQASMGAAMRAATAKVAGRAEGGRVAAVVRQQLSETRS